MTVTLYTPSNQPTFESPDGFSLPGAKRFASPIPKVAALLGCVPGLVDVLASGEKYVVYSIFDSEGPANPTATLAVAELIGSNFDVADEDELLRGPVLIVQA